MAHDQSQSRWKCFRLFTAAVTELFVVLLYQHALILFQTCSKTESCGGRCTIDTNHLPPDTIDTNHLPPDINAAVSIYDVAALDLFKNNQHLHTLSPLVFSHYLGAQ